MVHYFRKRLFERQGFAAFKMSLYYIILKGNQSYGFENGRGRKKAYINKMAAFKDLFLSFVAKVQQTGLQKRILEKEASRYQIPPLKSEKMDLASIKNLYSAIESKYTQSKELPEDPEGWNDNEKKLFIWIIIFYVYFLEEQGRVLMPSDWSQLSRMLFLKNPQFLRFQYLILVKPIGKIIWSPEEDNALNDAVEALEKGKWYDISRHIFVNSNYTMFKSPKHCRERWLNHLDDQKKRGNWSPDEDLAIFKFVAQNGKRWCKLVPVLNETRTEHMIKNRYNSLLNKQKMKKKESEDHMITKIIRQLKKQIANIEKRKLKKEEKMLEVSLEKQEASNMQSQIKKQQEEIQNPDLLAYKEQYESLDQKAIQTPQSVDQFLKREAKNESESGRNQKEQTDPAAKSSSDLPFYTPQQNIQNYPFLFEQQMQMMHYFYAYYPPR